MLAEVAFVCSTAELAGNGTATGDPTEVALLELAAACGLDVSARRRDAMRRRLFRFDPRIKLMTTVDQLDGSLVVHTKGVPEEVLARAARIRRGPDKPPITAADRAAAARVMVDYARQGLGVLAFGRQTLPAGSLVPGQREEAERDLCLIGLVAMLDPPRSEVPAAIRRVHQAGIRVHVVTGDNGLTAAAIARRIGIGTAGIRGLRDRPRRDDRAGTRRAACSAQLRFHPASSLSWRPSRSSSGAPTRSGGRWSAGGPSCEVAGDLTFSPPEPDQRPYLFVTAGEEAGR